MKMFKAQLAGTLKMTAVIAITVSALTWFVAHALAQYEPEQFYSSPLTAAVATTQSDAAATQEAVLIKAVLMENDKVVSRPYVSTSVGQTSSVSVSEAGADHQLTLFLTAGEAEGAFRQVKIDVKNTLGAAHWSLTTAAYFRNGEAMSFKLSAGKDAPEQTLVVTVVKAKPGVDQHRETVK